MRPWTAGAATAQMRRQAAPTLSRPDGWPPHAQPWTAPRPDRGRQARHGMLTSVSSAYTLTCERHKFNADCITSTVPAHRPQSSLILAPEKTTGDLPYAMPHINRPALAAAVSLLALYAPMSAQ